ncbi:MAG TPA: hypothetical protein VE869_13225 [Gemmatimonas sp.]|nr:hypothetical protein [Gemmatimonas sp.]
MNFLLPLAERPTDADSEWTAWQRAANAETTLPDASVFEVRYRVRFTPGGRK